VALLHHHECDARGVARLQALAGLWVVRAGECVKVQYQLGVMNSANEQLGAGGGTRGCSAAVHSATSHTSAPSS
jgi:hypothetical protein